MELSWKAKYFDGSELPQYNADGLENRYADIDRFRLASFALYDGEREIVRLFLESSNKRFFFRRIIVKLPFLWRLTRNAKRLIYRRRTRVYARKSPEVMWMLGWQQTIKGKNTQSIIYVFFEDTDWKVNVAGEWGTAPFNAVELLDFEKQVTA